MNRYHDVKHLTTAELQRAQRDLRATSGLITPDSPAHIPIQAEMEAIDTELAGRAENQKTRESSVMSTGTEPMTCDPLAALASEYNTDWKVWKPGRYVADHRRIDVSLKSNSIPGLAEKLNTFTQLLAELP